jgi:hypothetical protein
MILDWSRSTALMAVALEQILMVRPTPVLEAGRERITSGGTEAVRMAPGTERLLQE